MEAYWKVILLFEMIIWPALDAAAIVAVLLLLTFGTLALLSTHVWLGVLLVAAALWGLARLYGEYA